MPAAEAGAAGRGRDHRAGLDEDVEEALAHRLAVDALRRRDDDQPGSPGWTCGRAGSRPSGGGRSSSRSSSCRCTPGRFSSRSLPRPERRCPGGAGARRGARAPTGRSQLLRECRVGVGGQVAGDSPLDAARSRPSEVRRRLCRRPGTGRSRRPPRPPCSRRRGARRPTAPAPPSPTNSSTAFVAPPTPISPITARIRSLPADEPLLLAGELDADCPTAPPARTPRARGSAAMSVEPRPVPKAPSAPYVQVCESPPAITVARAESSPPRRAACARSRRGPGRRTSPPARSTTPSGAAGAPPSARPSPGAKWSATITTLRGSKTRSTPIFSSAGTRPGRRRRSP